MEIIKGLCLGEVYSISNGGSRIFQTEDNDPRGTNLLFNQFSPKLHENEKKNGREGSFFSCPVSEKILLQVGGDFSDTVLSQHMKFFGRAVFIGVISAYNVINPTKG